MSALQGHLRFMFILLFPYLNVNWARPGDSELNDHNNNNYYYKVSIGVIIDETSRVGKEEKIAIEMAILDLFAQYLPLHQPSLYVKEAPGDPVLAASYAKSLIKDNHAKAIITGLGTHQENTYIAKIGNKSRVPILSLASEAPNWASSYWPYMVPAAHSQHAQMKAVVAIIKTWNWRKVNIICEDTISSMTSIIPYLITAIQEVGSEINKITPFPPIIASPSSVSDKLKILKDDQTRVFIVHASLDLAKRILSEANSMGLMEKDSVWITTTSTTNLIDSINQTSIPSMQGLLGVRAYFDQSNEQFKKFSSRFQLKFHQQYPNEQNPEPSFHALQAYDATWALILALGRTRTIEAKVDGECLLRNLYQSNFEGMTGNYKFANNYFLNPARRFEIVNIVGKSYKELGYWTEGLGFSKMGKGKGKVNYSKSMTILGQVTWPGAPWTLPRGWALPINGKRLKIVVPGRATFKEFVNVKRYGKGGNDSIVEGYCIDVFKTIVDEYLPYKLPYDFYTFNGSYDSMMEQVELGNFDAAVGDTAIVANRCEIVEFSQPYSTTGLKIIGLKPKMDKAFLFTKPFTPGMWGVTGGMTIYNGFVLWLMERNPNLDFKGNKWNQIGTMLSLGFITLFSQDSGRLHNNLSRVTMVVWLFVAIVLIGSYTASLSSLLTVSQLTSANINVDSLRSSGAKVGCDGHSFVPNYLEHALGFKNENIVRVYNDYEYPEMLTNGEIKAAFLQIPYVDLFLAKYCSRFIAGNETFKVGGWGFVFRRGSDYIADISEAVVRISENGRLIQLEKTLYSSFNCSASNDHNQQSLGLDCYWGLFVITGVTSSAALVIFSLRERRKNQICCSDKPDQRNIQLKEVNDDVRHQSEPSEDEIHVTAVHH